MKQNKLVFLGVALAICVFVTGCAKKSSDQASMTGFESLSTNEELAQLPQSSATSSANQQGGIEVLPVETSPVTQGISSQIPSSAIQQVSAAVSTATASVDTSRDKLIQTALKNAGFYNGNIDGKIGPASKRAIEAFQKSNSLKADGKVGPMTWSAMQQYLNGASAGVTAIGSQASTTASE